MAPAFSSDDRSPQEELAEQQEKKEEEVLKREPLEQELMEEGESEVGEEIEGYFKCCIAVRDGASGKATGGDVQGDLPPVVSGRGQLETSLAHDLGVAM